MKKYFVVLFCLFFNLGMVNVNAWTIFFEQDEFNGYVYGDRLNPGEDIPFLLMPQKDDSEILGDFTVTATITYDNNVFEFRDYVDHYNYYDVNAQTGKVIVKFSSNALKNLSYLALNFKAKSSISSNVSRKISLEYEKNGVLENITETLNVVKPSSNALLSSLSIKEGVLSPSFNSNIFEYSATVNSEYLTVQCKKADQYSYCSECDNGFIDMQYILRYGLNNISIDVTAEDGTKKTYKLAITRIDSRSDDATLKNISLSNGSIDFNKTQKEYNIEVTSDNVKLNAIANHDKAKVEYLNGDTVNLNYGETKTLKIKVTSEKGNTSTYTVNLTRKDTRSDDSTLKNITISDGNIDFNNSKRDYSVTVSSYSVTVNATKNNSNAILEYLTENTVYLGYGESQIVKVKVTSEKGTSSIYSVTLTRKDTRSNDATLKSLTVTNTDIKFNGSTTYNTQVGNNVSKIEIKVNANDNKAIVSGAGIKNLIVGNNSFIITVEAENGDTKNYVIVINRRAKISENNKNEVNKLSSDNKLKSLTIDEISFEFDKDILDYNLFVDYNVNKINVNYVASSDKATVTMTDISYLEIGLNIVDLIVVAEDGSVKIYTLNITRRPERLVTENNSESILELINSDSYEDIYVVDESRLAPYTITSDVLTALKETGKTIIYEITDDLGLVYQIKFVGGELTDTNELRFAVWFKSSNSLAINSIVGSQEYLSFRFDVEGDVPNGVHLSIYKFTQVSDKENLDLYEYDESNNKLNLILNDLIIKDNVIELDIDDLTKEYVIAEIIPIETTGKKVGESTTINLPLIFVIILFLGSVISLVVIAIKKKINLKKQLKLYGVADTNNIDLDNKKF